MQNICSPVILLAPYAPHVGQASLELVDKMAPHSALTNPELENDHVLLSSDLVVSVLFLLARVFFCPLALECYFCFNPQI